jgi:hypothetical protein
MPKVPRRKPRERAGAELGCGIDCLALHVVTHVTTSPPRLVLGSHRSLRNWQMGVTMSWKLWAWQRAQQLVSALAVLIPTALFFCFLVWDFPTQNWITPTRNQDVSLGNLDNPRWDHVHIATAIGSCHLRTSPVDWPQHWREILKISQSELNATDRSNHSNAVAMDAVSGPGQREYKLTPFERAAIYHSDRVAFERNAFAAEADNRQRRLRSNQTRILFVSAAAAFLVGMRAPRFRDCCQRGAQGGL